MISIRGLEGLDVYPWLPKTPGKSIPMKKFDPDQLLLALILGGVIIGLGAYRFFFTY